MSWSVEEWAERLSAAARSRQPVDPDARPAAGPTPEQARDIRKVGLASALAHQRLVGGTVRVHGRALWTTGDPGVAVAGFITDAMIVPPEYPIDTATMIAPSATIALAFVLGRDLGARPTIADILAAASAVHGAVEIVDSRFGSASITPEEMIADNAANGLVIVSTGSIDPASADLALLGCALEHNGRIAAGATGAAAFGHPAAAIMLAAADLADLGACRAGSLLIAGNLTDPVALTPGDTIRALFARIGSIDLAIT